MPQAVIGGQSHLAPVMEIDNHLRSLREARGLSQGVLGGMAGVTRQAIYAIEANQYLPTTAVALRLAHALSCRVEDLFSLGPGGDVIEGQWIGPAPSKARDALPTRVKVARVGERLVIRPVADLGDVLNFTVGADGFLVPGPASTRKAIKQGRRARVELLRDRRSFERDILVAGCDPAMFLVGEHIRRRQDLGSVVGWTMGSGAAIEALKRQEVHVAGMHVLDAQSGECNLPYLRRHLRGRDVTVVTFASWEQGLMVPKGNPKRIRGLDDLTRKDVSLVNREKGSGARLLLDQHLRKSGIEVRQVQGYAREAYSHVQVARWIAEGHGDTGVGVRSAARMLMLDFIPIQQERYDLVIPTSYLDGHPGLSGFLDTISSRSFRAEIEALGGYDTRETGRTLDWARSARG